jgi:hypothetical protein
MKQTITLVERGLQLAALFVFLASEGCGILSSNSATIKGRVRFSDNPATGYSGVTVRTDYVSTISDKDGSFSLEGKFMGSSEQVALVFEKTGYVQVQRTVQLDETKDGSTVVDIGTIILNKR